MTHITCHVGQGDIAISTDPSICQTTVLGSCIAVCLFDPLNNIGGMVHYLLPDAPGGAPEQERQSLYGPWAIGLLCDQLGARGAQVPQLRAKIFGGGAVLAGLCDIGQQNAAVAIAKLGHIEIPIIAHDTGGVFARRVRFFPTTGNAHVRRIKISPP